MSEKVLAKSKWPMAHLVAVVFMTFECLLTVLPLLKETESNE